MIGWISSFELDIFWEMYCLLRFLLNVQFVLFSLLLVWPAMLAGSSTSLIAAIGYYPRDQLIYRLWLMTSWHAPACSACVVTKAVAVGAQHVTAGRDNRRLYNRLSMVRTCSHLPDARRCHGDTVATESTPWILPQSLFYVTNSLLSLRMILFRLCIYLTLRD